MSITNVPFFSPRSITGCSFWFDATDSSTITLSSGSLTQWNDKSGNGKNFTAVSGYANATVSSAYQNGLNVFNFSGNGLYRTPAGSAVYPQDAYIVVALKSTTSHVDVLGMGDAAVDNFNSLTFAESAVSKWHNGSSGGARQTISDTTETSTSFLLMQWSIANGNYLLRRNGTQLIQASRTYSFNNSSTAIFQIGFRHTNITAANFSGYIGEIAVFNSQLGTTDRQNIESYLAQKWGLTAGLPAGHPGATAVVYRSPSFLPTQISGCSLWLDAADPAATGISPTNSSSVSTWFDKSGNGFNASSQLTAATNAQNAFNGLNSISFSGTARYLTSVTGFNNTAYTIFVVQYTTNSSGIYQRTLHGSTGNQYLFIGTSSGNVATFSGSGSAWNDVAANSTNINNYNLLRIVCMQVSGSTLYPFTDGSSQTTKTGTTGSFSSFYIGNDNANTQPWYGYICEIIIYNSAFTTSQRQQVEGYLAKKWGLSSSLSSDHLGATSVAFKSSLPLLTPVPFTSLPYAFAPTQIAGCSLWLDGADPAGTGVVPANNAAITTWADKSGLGNTATNQGSAGSVTFTAAGLVFNGSGYFYMPGLAGNLVNKAFVIFMVETLNTTGGTMLIGDDAQTNYGTNNALHIMYRTSTNHTFAFYANDLENTNVSGTGTRRLWTFWLPTASNRVTRRNGAVDVTHSNYDRLNYWSTPAIGRGFGGYNYVGTMSEVIIYPSDIGISNIQKVEAYLGQKWGLKSSLGAGHVGLTTDYFNSQSILSRAALTAPVLLSLTTGSATGGTITTANGYRTHSFTTVGSTNFVVTGALKLQVLIVGGGGGGGFTNCAGGGGAGGAVATILVISAGTFSVTVGGGGTGGNYTASVLTQATNGSSSSFNGITGIGGGYGGTITSPINGASGGCGGGGSYNGGLGAGGTQGGSGANGSGFGTPPNSGAGGGGMGGNGGAPNLVGGNSGGAGGLGVTYVIGGTSYTVSGGGAGGSDGNQGSGGSGIGGNGGTPGTPLGAAGNGTQNTGSGGGGGGGGFADTRGGNGGSGIIVIAYVFP